MRNLQVKLFNNGLIQQETAPVQGWHKSINKAKNRQSENEMMEFRLERNTADMPKTVRRKIGNCKHHQSKRWGGGEKAIKSLSLSQ